MKTHFRNQLYLLIIIDLLVAFFGNIEGDSEFQILLANLVLGIAQLTSLIGIIRKHNHNALVIYLTISILLIVSVLLFNNIIHILMMICFCMAHIYVLMLYKILHTKEPIR